MLTASKSLFVIPEAGNYDIKGKNGQLNTQTMNWLGLYCKAEIVGMNVGPAAAVIKLCKEHMDVKLFVLLKKLPSDAKNLENSKSIESGTFKI